MKNLSVYFLTAALGLSILGGCKKDSDDTATPAKTKTELLVGKDWVLTDITLSQGNTPGASVYGLVDVCTRDDKYRFATPNAVTVSAGAMACSTSPTSPGTWAFASSETKLNLTNVGDALDDGSYNIVELTETSMKLSATVTQGTITYTTTGIFVKQ